MKAPMILALSLALAATGLAADNTDGNAAAISSAPKNLARQHLGANLLVYNTDSKTYEPTEAAAAWLDDDVATGWPAMTGHQDYLLALPDPQLVNSFGISARTVTGTVSLYAGDEMAAPGAKSWTLLEKDVPIDSLNDKTSKPFGRFAKYILIETDLTESGPWYSVYLYGEKAAADYRIEPRAQPVDPRTIFGPWANPQTAFNLSSLYAHSRVTLSGGDPAVWQQAIDDDPQTGTFVPASTDTAGLVIDYDRSYAIQRISVLTDPGTKGKLDLFVVTDTAVKSAAAGAAAKSNYIRVADQTTDGQQMQPIGPASAPLNGMQPVGSMTFDGSSPRASIDFTPTPGTKLMARWTPDTAGQPLNVREINSFGDVALNDYELAPAPEAVGEGPANNETSGKESEGKENLPAVGEQLPAVGEQDPVKTPFIPGVPVFPPTIPFSN